MMAGKWWHDTSRATGGEGRCLKPNLRKYQTTGSTQLSALRRETNFIAITPATHHASIT